MSAPRNDWRPDGVAFDWLPKWAFDVIDQGTDQKLPALLLYLAFCKAANLFGPSFEKPLGFVASLAFLSKRTAVRNLPILERLGLVIVERRQEAGAKEKAPSRYKVAKDCPHKVAPSCLQVATDKRLMCGVILKEGRELQNKPGSPSGSRSGSEPKPTKLKASKPAADPIPIPAELLAVPGFENSWAEWLGYRRRRRLTLDPATVRRQLAMLAAAPGDAVAVIEQSLDKGWAGLFPVKGGRPAPAKDADAEIKEWIET